MKEQWKDICGYAGMYRVSSWGRVMSLKYKLPRILKTRTNERGYKYVNLSKYGRYRSLTVHRLVAIAFMGESKLTVNHLNGNKLNNCVDNLEWINLNDNRRHAKENTLFAKGERNGRSKLTTRDVKLMRYKSTLGRSQRGLSREFGVSHFTVGAIINNVYWV